ncbi:acyl-CoA thioester hydrolase [Parasphingorhabdus marina DSM 22363]|uniref:Acyl-CoA thioester hydrolase n=1 Tax=Parasphingorhabdus marina DSM 22363 TaxID=1123272 RepID=A0A1N6CZU7_9SPHN|nr:thioesterase family protein [Parasphingorhabdus marina]SIN63973.1 acyl-CoA thioester hydrolase [Parasphingorhabdus marina DSM 22363]
MTESQNSREGFRLITPLRVRYAEADMQGIVFNANYLAFADVGVTEYFRALVGAQGNEDSLGKFLELFGGDNWVRHAEVDFHAPAKADDMIDICLRITRFGRTSYSALAHIVRDDTLLNVIKLTYVWFDPATEKVTPVSPKFIEAVTEFEIIAPELAAVHA